MKAAGRSPVRRDRAWAPLALALSTVAGLALLAELAARLGLVSAFLLPPPSSVLASFAALVESEALLSRAIATAAAVVAAISLAAVIGGAVGYALARHAVARAAYRGWIVGLNATPSFLFYPLFLAIFGRSSATVVALGVLSSFPPVALLTCEGLLAIPVALRNAGRNAGARRWQLVWLVELPAATPTILTGLRLGLIDALVTVVGVEFLAAAGGLGGLIADLGDRFNIRGTYGAILALILLSALLQGLVGRLARRHGLR
ncbi:MAG: ABC transporter permease subunit [Bauldia sp.]